MGGDFSLLHVPSRSMRDNLLFTNIDETENDKKDTEEVLNEWLDKYMGITNIAFERVHRLQIGRREETTYHSCKVYIL